MTDYRRGPARRNRGRGDTQARYAGQQDRWDAVLANPASLDGVPGDLSRSLAEVVLELAQERDLSVNALCKAAGLPQSTTSRRLRGLATLDADDLAGMAVVFGMTAAELVDLAERR